MPRGDGTGPAGMGPMTGRAAGYCAGYSVPGYMNPVGGRGYGGWGRGFRGGGFGRGRGFGWAGAGYGTPAWGGGVSPYAYGGAAGPYAYGGAPVAPTVAPEQELAGLKQEAEYFENALGEIKKRIEQLEAESKKKARK